MFIYMLQAYDLLTTLSINYRAKDSHPKHIQKFPIVTLMPKPLQEI